MCLFLRVNLGSYSCEFFIFPRRAGWVNPCAKGLVRLDGSVSPKGQGSHSNFKGIGPLYFLLLYQAADADRLQDSTVSSQKPLDDVDSSHF